MVGKRLQLQITFSDNPEGEEAGIHVESIPFVEGDLQDMHPANYLTMIVMAEAVFVVTHDLVIARFITEKYGSEKIRKEVERILPFLDGEINQDDLAEHINKSVMEYFIKKGKTNGGGNGQ